MSPEAGPLPLEEFARLLEVAAAGSNPPLSPAAMSALSVYLSELDRWRRRINLTGPLSGQELVGHALESVAGQALITDGAEVVDIGSGAGFPGLPLALVRPDLRVTPLERRQKRAEFLRHVVRTVPIPNCFVVRGGAEKLAEAVYDVAVSRAVGGIGDVLGDARFLKPGGVFLAWTTDPDELSRSLAPAFSLERAIPVPATRRKAIAVFRRQI